MRSGPSADTHPAAAGHSATGASPPGDALAPALRRERERAEQAAQARAQFLHRIGQELRLPLLSVLSFTRLLEDDPADPPSDRQRARLARIAAAGERMQLLLDQVHDLARLDAQRPRTEAGVVPVDELLRAAQAAVAGGAAASLLANAVRLRWPVRVHGQLLGNRGRLVQALQLVIEHALAAAPNGATLSVSVEPPLHDDAPHLHVAVQVPAPQGAAPQPTLFDLAALDDAPPAAADTAAAASALPGAGLAHGLQEGLQDDLSNGLPNGLPLGLQLAQQLLQAEGGALERLDEPGATLHLLQLPAAPAARAAPPPPLHVLCVEDNPVNLLLVRELFALRPALRLSTAVDGQGGLSAAHADPPDLVLLDLQLPDMHGVQVMQKLRADPALCRCRIVAVSADAMPEHVAWARAQGFDDYWTKPLQFDQLLAQLDALSAAHGAQADLDDQVAGPRA